MLVISGRPALSCLAVALCGLPIPAQEATQSATVVFFTPGSHWRGTVSQLKTLIAGKGDIASTGSVFDGKSRLVSLSHTRYVALQTSAGPHTFSANLTGNHPKASETVALSLTAGTVTYVAITTTVVNYGMGVYSKLTSHIEVATCEDFAAENVEHPLEAVETKHVAEAYRPQVVPESALPACGK